MNKIEKYLILIFLISAACGIVLKIIGLASENYFYHAQLISFSIYTLIGLTFYYAIKTSISIYTLIFILLIINIYGLLSKIMHWSGSGSFQLIGILSIILIIWTFLRKGINMIKIKNREWIWFIILALILVAEIIIPFTKYSFIGLKLSYFLLLTILTMKAMGINLKLNENRILNILLLMTIYPILADLFS